jgi:UDP-N-acetylmuramoyl-tripeptide--D-alanyl-D-alanine ligase
MPLWTTQEIKSALGEQLICTNEVNDQIETVIIDSRKKIEKGLFIAIKGDNKDGHDFLSQAFNNGCILAIVEEIPTEFIDDERLILVKNSQESLNRLAVFSQNRSKEKSQAKIIAVTGSVGKTNVKEMLNLIFSSQGKTFASPGNFNNNFGLSISLANMPADTQFGIFEMGMNHAKEIESLSKIAHPNVVIINNVNSAHIGNFKSEEEIALAKSEIFCGLEEGGFAIINNDNKHYKLIKEQALNCNVKEDNIVNFGSKKTSNFRILSAKKINNELSKVDIFLSKEKKQISYTINTINQAVIFNSLAAISCLYLIGNNFESGQ